jgi:hypothetical protein
MAVLADAAACDSPWLGAISAAVLHVSVGTQTHQTRRKPLVAFRALRAHDSDEMEALQI